MITDMFNLDIARILTFFSISPGSGFTRNELKQKGGFNNVPLDRSLKTLKMSRILKKDRRIYRLNLANTQARRATEFLGSEYRRLNELPLEVYYLLMELSAGLSVVSGISRVLLFGSYAKLVHSKDSDIDIAVILEKDNRKAVAEIKKASGKLKRKFPYNVEEHFFTEKDMKAKDPLIKEIKKNSVELLVK